HFLPFHCARPGTTFPVEPGSKVPAATQLAVEGQVTARRDTCSGKAEFAGAAGLGTTTAAPAATAMTTAIRRSRRGAEAIPWCRTIPPIPQTPRRVVLLLP